jgi:hypothetical protein
MNYKIINKNNKFIVTKGINSISFDNEEDANRFVKVSEYLIENPEINESINEEGLEESDDELNSIPDYIKSLMNLGTFKF